MGKLNSSSKAAHQQQKRIEIRLAMGYQEIHCMFATLIKALEVDWQNYEDARYQRSATNVNQTLQRILSIRKNYPEYQPTQTLLFPQLFPPGKLTSQHDAQLNELGLATRRSADLKHKLLNKYIGQAKDSILMNHLSESTFPHADEFVSQNNAQISEKQNLQVVGLLYQLSLLEAQLESMMLRFQRRNQTQKPAHTPASVESDGPIDIWYGLAEDPQTPYRFLVWLSENHNPYVSQRALQTLQRQKMATKTA